MNRKKIVVALGGNALGDTPQEQLAAVKKAADIIATLAADGNDIVVGHGNGPQVGMIKLAMDHASSNGPKTPVMPLAECGAMSQGYIGYHLQQALGQSLREKGIDAKAICVVTQVVVDSADPAFEKPSKPIGRFYTKEEADAIVAETGFTFVEDAGRGYRRVVPSPQPQEIVELDAVNLLSSHGSIAITVGGGGIPVVREDGKLKGIDAVIDKDKSCSRLAQDLKADVLMVLTAVDRVCIHFNTPDQKALERMTVAEARQYIGEKHFAPGSMLPKVEACIAFVEGNPAGEAIITSLDQAAGALRGETGTKIVK